MKILVPSPVTPNIKSLRTLYISEITKHLKEIINLDFFWFVYQPDRISFSDVLDSNILDIHNYNNAIDCLNQIKPNCVMVGSRYEPIQYAFSLASKKLKIPLVSFYYTGYESEKSEYITYYNKLVSYSRIITSSQIPTDSAEQKFFLRRLKFILFKINFLGNTKKAIKQKSNFIGNIFSYFQYAFTPKGIPINELPDLHLLPDPSWIEPLQKIGIQKNKLFISGSPFWDRLYQISKRYNPKKTTQNNISILIITDALVEHGMWTRNKFTSLITDLINELSKKSEFSFSFKIHPASEDKKIYQDLFQNLDINLEIYQNEDVWDIIEKYDLVITFGVSTIHSELSLVGVKTIMLNFNFNLPLMTFVKEGIEFGNIMVCTDIYHLNNMIINFTKKNNIPNELFISAREKFLYKFDGKSGLRISEELIKLINNTSSLN
jgi:hypothetical protein